MHLHLLPHVYPDHDALWAELALYRTKAWHASEQHGRYEICTEILPVLLEFLRRHSLDLPSWYKAVREVALMPSSACVERVFAQCRAVFDDSGRTTLERLS